MLAAATMSRRRLLQSGGAALALYALGGSPFGSRAFAGGASDPLARSRFRDLVGRDIRVRSPHLGPTSLRLERIEDLLDGRHGFAGAEDAYALHLRGPEKPRLEQAVVTLEHPDGDELELLMSPSDTGPQYAIIVNRRTPPVVSAKAPGPAAAPPPGPPQAPPRPEPNAAEPVPKRKRRKRRRRRRTRKRRARRR